MKKLTKRIAGLTAAAALLLGVSCTSQDDYVNEAEGTSKAVRNAFNVAGLYVEGLDAGYNGSEAILYVSGVDEDGKKDDIAAIKGKVADSYTDEGGTVVGYKSGTVYKEESYLYDGDVMALSYAKANKTSEDYEAFAASSFECYLSVGSDTIKVLSADGSAFENAKLSVPTSEAGTSDSALVSKWVKVIVKDGVGTFSFVSKPDEPVNATLTCLTLDCSKLTESEGAYTLTKTAKAGTEKKYTLIVKGLDEDQVGFGLQLAGSQIAPIEEGKTYEKGDYWYGGPTDLITAEKQAETPLYQKIAKVGDNPTDTEKALGLEKDDVYVSWAFYGSAPSYSTTDGPAIKVYPAGPSAEVKDKKFFLKTGVSGNFCMPNSDGDLELTIDVKKLKSGTDYEKADPVSPVAKVYIDGITILNAPKIGTAGYIAFCEGWLPNNEWSAKTTNKVTSLDNGSATLWFAETLEYTPGVGDFTLAIQMLNPSADAENDGDTVGSKHFWDDDSKIGGGTITTGKYSSTVYDGRHIMLVVDAANTSKVVSFIANAESFVASKTVNLKVKGIKLENAPAIGKAGYIAFCEEWLPNNEWGANTTNKVTTLTNGTAVLEFNSAKEVSKKPYFGSVAIQILNPESDADFWADASKVTGGVINVTVPGMPYNDKEVYMVVTLDSASNSASVKSAKFVLAE